MPNDVATIYDVFISYSHHDKNWVHQHLVPELEKAHVRVCIDFRDFQTGAPLVTEIERAIIQSRKTLLVITPDYLASEWTEFESIMTQTLDPAARNRQLLPLVLKRSSLPLRIRGLIYLDFTESAEMDSQMQKLFAAIQFSETGLSSQTQHAILIVEDDPRWQVVFKKILKREGHLFEAAAGYGEARTRIQTGRFDLAIVDLRLRSAQPNNTEGMKVVEEAYKNDILSIVVTGDLQSEETVTRLFNDYTVIGILEKHPWNRDLFLKLLKRGLDQKPRQNR